jgi:hypothetical protein
VFRRLDRMRDAGPAVAVRSDHVTVGTAVQITAAAVLLQEGVERGEETTRGLSLEVARPHRANARRFGVTDQTGTKRKSYLVVNSLSSSASLVSI